MRRAIVAALAVVALAGCGDTPEDQAREAGEDVGEAARELTTATSPAQAQDALGDLREEVSDLDDDVRERIADQIEVQRTTLENAVGGGADAIKAAVQEMRAQAAAFREGNDAIGNEFWRGVELGYEDG